MRQKMMLTALLCVTTTAFGQSDASLRAQSYYGFSGLTFIPTAQALPAGTVSSGYMSKPVLGEDLTLEPFSTTLGYGTKVEGLEVALTNTPFYASAREFGGVDITTGLREFNTVVPLFPSIKYQIMPMVADNHEVAMAIGLALPYGAYYVVDKYFNARGLSVILHSGVGTKLTTYHVFGGTTLTFGNPVGRLGRDFPVEIMLEGSWGGSLKQLDEKEEAFFAATFRYRWSSDFDISTFLRVDSQPFLNPDTGLEPGPTKRVGIGLNYTLQR